MTIDIDNTQDILDGCDVIERFDELESERQDLVGALEEASGKMTEDGTASDEEARAKAELDQWDADNADELKTLADFISDGSDEWRHGETLIRDSYFEDYARELAEDLHGDQMRELAWPFSCIDWEQATRELQMDYSSADFDGVTYWYRS